MAVVTALKRKLIYLGEFVMKTMPLFLAVLTTLLGVTGNNASAGAAGTEKAAIWRPLTEALSSEKWLER